MRASSRQRGVTHALPTATPPAVLGLPPGVLLYGIQRGAAEFIEPGASSEPLGLPPRYRDCRNATVGVTYGFGGATQSSGTG